MSKTMYALFSENKDNKELCRHSIAKLDNLHDDDDKRGCLVLLTSDIKILASTVAKLYYSLRQRLIKDVAKKYFKDINYFYNNADNEYNLQHPEDAIQHIDNTINLEDPKDISIFDKLPHDLDDEELIDQFTNYINLHTTEYYQDCTSIHPNECIREYFWLKYYILPINTDKLYNDHINYLSLSEYFELVKESGYFE